MKCSHVELTRDDRLPRRSPEEQAELDRLADALWQEIDAGITAVIRGELIPLHGPGDVVH
jgi:hypothetical protein